MAPEVICKMDHSYPVDFFALGVIAYEFMVGKVSIHLNSETLRGTEQKGNQRENSGQASPAGWNSSFWLVQVKRGFRESAHPKKTRSQVRISRNIGSQESPLVQKNRLGKVGLKKTSGSFPAAFYLIRLQQLQTVYFRRHWNRKHGRVQVGFAPPGYSRSLPRIRLQPKKSEGEEKGFNKVIRLPGTDIHKHQKKEIQQFPMRKCLGSKEF